MSGPGGIPSPVRGLRGDRRFHWRGGQVSRLEAFSDAVFAFSLTLLVISLDPIQTVSALDEALLRLPGFAISATVLVWIWYLHHLYFRRFGLEDVATTILNGVLLFLVLFYVYPLRLLFTALTQSLFFGETALVRGPGGEMVPMMPGDSGTRLMLFYSTGFTLVFVLFAILYWRALRLGDRLGLTRTERFLTRVACGSYLINAVVGILSLVLAIIRPDKAPLAGLIYFLIGPSQGVFHALAFRRANRQGIPLDPVAE